MRKTFYALAIAVHIQAVPGFAVPYSHVQSTGEQGHGILNPCFGAIVRRQFLYLYQLRRTLEAMP
jgi:hypothetical protein